MVVQIKEKFSILPAGVVTLLRETTNEHDEFYVFCTVNCDRIMQHKLTKCTLFKLMF